MSSAVMMVENQSAAMPGVRAASRVRNPTEAMAKPKGLMRDSMDGL